MHAEIASVAGSECHANEDWAGVTPTALVLLDGLTAPRELASGCIHGVPWYVGRLGPALLTRLAEPAHNLKSCLALAIEDTARHHVETCDLTNPGTPQATVAIVRVQEAQLEWLVLADSIIVVDLSGVPQVISDDRVKEAVKSEQDEALSGRVGTSEHGKGVSRLVEAQRSMRNKPGGYWVAAADPASARESMTGTLPLSDVTRVAMLSDGAARLVEFGLSSWEDVLSELSRDGPQNLINNVRQIEATDPHGERWPRFKASDDATAVFAKL